MNKAERMCPARFVVLDTFFLQLNDLDLYRSNYLFHGLQLPVWISQQSYPEDPSIAEYAEMEQKLNKVKIWTAELDTVLMKDQLREIEVWKQYIHWHGYKQSVSPYHIFILLLICSGT